MMKFLYLTLLIFVFQTVNAQDYRTDSLAKDAGGGIPEEITDSIIVCKLADVQAQFVGGDNAFNEFLMSNFIFPERCREEGIGGRVLLRFVVDTKGRISQISAIEETKSCPEFTTEAIRVLKMSPKWIPGLVNGRYVNSWRQLPIKLTLE
jgi:Gram-negative bacterial TonB protein C-terminal